MSELSLAKLPLEIQCDILHNLPVTTLLIFARTSRNNYGLVRTVLTTLHLAVFSKKVHGVLAFLNVAHLPDIRAYNFLNEPELDWMNLPIKVPDKDIPPVNGRWPRSRRRRGAHTDIATHNHSVDDDSSRQERLPTPAAIPSPPRAAASAASAASASAAIPGPQAYRERQIHHQNAHLSSILSSSCLRSLASLTIHTYALLSPSLASTLSTRLPNLRHLVLNFSHPAVHDPCLPSFYWDTCPTLEKEGSTAWNLLAGIGSSSGGGGGSINSGCDRGAAGGANRDSTSTSGNPNLRGLHLRGLQTLSIRRAAISNLQLSKWIERNPEMRDLKLALVTGVDQVFVEGLAKMSLLPEAATHRRSRLGLRTLVLEACPNLELGVREDFAWVEVLLEAGLRELSFRDCENVDMNVLREVIEERGWTDKQGLLIPRLEEDGDDLETKSLTYESTVTGTGKAPIIEIDPEFERR